MRQFLCDASELGLDLLVDYAESGIDAAAAGRNLRIGDDFGLAERLDFFQEERHLFSHSLQIDGVHVNLHIGVRSGEIERLTEPCQANFRLFEQLLADDPCGDCRGDMYAGRFPVSQPCLFCVDDLLNGLFQGRQDGRHLFLDHRFDRFHCGLFAFLLGLASDAIRFLLCLRHQFRGFDFDLGKIGICFAGHILEVKCDALRCLVVVGGSDDGGHGGGRLFLDQGATAGLSSSESPFCIAKQPSSAVQLGGAGEVAFVDVGDAASDLSDAGTCGFNVAEPQRAGITQFMADGGGLTGREARKRPLDEFFLRSE